MFAKPQSEHEWLSQLLGDWTADSECVLPGQPAQKSSGRMTCRTMGGLWVLMEGAGESPDGSNWTSLMTLGFDTRRNHYAGTFVASMMSHLWVYQGALDESGKRLVLDVEGPTLDGSGMAIYQDIIEVIDQDCWRLSSQILGKNGEWNRFMTADHRRAQR
ncbi:DUF1579 domain-containing protein [Planctomycetes bacterium K23_9]|uniref:DUF1579 domain-containing protein n=1 Tax=Stieleria marina TaxID=1930275 RepID=A0A517P187_9BACT|nr:hypothetical protein K239x_51420 [Planctomycetes bacterium K23_9]